MLSIVVKERCRLGISITGLTETHIAGNGIMSVDHNSIVFSGGSGHIGGVARFLNKRASCLSDSSTNMGLASSSLCMLPLRLPVTQTRIPFMVNFPTLSPLFLSMTSCFMIPVYVHQVND